MAKKKAPPPAPWYELLETGDRITCVTPYGLVPDVYEPGDVAIFIAREGGGLRIKNRGEVMIVSPGDFLPCTPEGMEYAEILMKINRLNMDEDEDD